MQQDLHKRDQTMEEESVAPNHRSPEESGEAAEQDEPHRHHRRRCCSRTIIPLHELIPSTIHGDSDPINVLASFSDLRRKTLDLLYPPNTSTHTNTNETPITPSADSAPPDEPRREVDKGKDKSPKGSVDVLIRPLIDLINHHPHYASLSSCSGRISIFNPNVGVANIERGNDGDGAGAGVGGEESGNGSESADDASDTAGGGNTAGTNSSSIKNASINANVNPHHQYDSKAAISSSLTPSTSNGNNGIDNDSNNSNSNDINRKRDVDSGKGSGNWWLVSHDAIEDNPNAIIDCLNAHTNDAAGNSHSHSDETAHAATTPHPLHSKPLVFKVEPLLLHITAATVADAQRLLQVALGCGYRESGLIVSATKVTVAIRGYSLALTVPLSVTGDLRPSDEYLRSLLKVANGRMHRNVEQSDRLYQQIQATLFHRMEKIRRYQSTFHNVNSIPRLNLWSHAAIAVPMNNFLRKPCESVMFVFGGYGSGPSAQTAEAQGKVPGSSRSGKIYFLVRDHVSWSSQWTENVLNDSDVARPQLSWMGIPLMPCKLPPCQGLTGHHIPTASDSHSDFPSGMILLWGGRKSPKEALNEIFLFSPDHHDVVFRPADSTTRGTPPLGRWGHTMTPIPLTAENHSIDGEILCRFLIFGGRNTDGVINQDNEVAFILSLAKAKLKNDETVSSLPQHEFRWETVALQNGNSFRPRFHHVSLYLSSPPMTSGTDDTSIPISTSTHRILVTGGLKSTNSNLLDAFGGESISASTPKVVTYDLIKHRIHGWQMKVSDEESTPDQQVASPLEYVGVGACVTEISRTNDSVTIVISGGCCDLSDVSDNQRGGGSNSAPIKVVRVPCKHPITASQQLPLSIKAAGHAGAQCNFGSLTHHTCTKVATKSSSSSSSSSELLIVGGGVVGFAFGDIFARSYAGHLQLHAVEETDTNMHHGKSAAGEQQGSHGSSANGRFSKGAPNPRRKQHVSSASHAHDTNMPPPTTDVFVVEAKHAKTIKQALDGAGILDKRYRMSQYKQQDEESANAALKLIAIPIVNKTNRPSNDSSWKSMLPASCVNMVIAEDHQEMPFSTSQFARKSKI